VNVHLVMLIVHLTILVVRLAAGVPLRRRVLVIVCTNSGLRVLPSVIAVLLFQVCNSYWRRYENENQKRKTDYQARTVAGADGCQGRSDVFIC